MLSQPVLLEEAIHSWIVQMNSIHCPEWFYTPPGRHQQLSGSRVEVDEVGDVVHTVLEGHPHPASALLSAGILSNLWWYKESLLRTSFDH